MARQNSAKKVAKVARSGRSRAVKQPRQLGFPLLVTGVIVVGLVLVFVARGERESTAGEQPRLNIATENGVSGDHWHAPYGLYVCTDDDFYPDLVDTQGDATGIHTHADGFIHIHPVSARARGSRATLEVFFDEVGIDASDDEWELPDGEVLANGDECADGREGTWRVAKWDSLDDTEPEIFEGGFDRIRFRQDGEVYSFYFGPESDEIPLPPNASTEPADEGFAVGSEPGDVTIGEPETDSTDTTEAPDATEAPTTTSAG